MVHHGKKADVLKRLAQLLRHTLMTGGVRCRYITEINYGKVVHHVYSLLVHLCVSDSRPLGESGQAEPWLCQSLDTFKLFASCDVYPCLCVLCALCPPANTLYNTL